MHYPPRRDGCPMRQGLAAFVLCVVVAIPQFASAQTSKDRAYVDAVLDGLVKAGVLKADQATQIKKDAEAAAAGAAAAEKPRKSWTRTPLPVTQTTSSCCVALGSR
jgi:hypothetical protein